MCVEPKVLVLNNGNSYSYTIIYPKGSLDLGAANETTDLPIHMKHKQGESRSSSTSSEDSDEERKRKHKKAKKKSKKKEKKAEKKRKKQEKKEKKGKHEKRKANPEEQEFLRELKQRKLASQQQASSASSASGQQTSSSADAPASKPKSMVPMSAADYEKRQQQVRSVFDPGMCKNITSCVIDGSSDNPTIHKSHRHADVILLQILAGRA